MCLKISDLLFKVFGVWLSQQELGSDGIPHLVAKCLQFVETYGMSVLTVCELADLGYLIPGKQKFLWKEF